MPCRCVSFHEDIGRTLRSVGKETVFGLSPSYRRVASPIYIIQFIEYIFFLLMDEYFHVWSVLLSVAETKGIISHFLLRTPAVKRVQQWTFLEGQYRGHRTRLRPREQYRHPLFFICFLSSYNAWFCCSARRDQTLTGQSADKDYAVCSILFGRWCQSIHAVCQ